MNLKTACLKLTKICSQLFNLVIGVIGVITNFTVLVEVSPFCLLNVALGTLCLNQS